MAFVIPQTLTKNPNIQSRKWQLDLNLGHPAGFRDPDKRRKAFEPNSKADLQIRQWPLSKVNPKTEMSRMA